MAGDIKGISANQSRAPSVTRYTMLNQYHVVLEVDPKFQYGPEALNGIYVRSSIGQQMARMADPAVVQTE
jgi:multidrug efflux pump subunit AcrB